MLIPLGTKKTRSRLLGVILVSSYWWRQTETILSFFFFFQFFFFFSPCDRFRSWFWLCVIFYCVWRWKSVWCSRAQRHIGGRTCAVAICAILEWGRERELRQASDTLPEWHRKCRHLPTTSPCCPGDGCGSLLGLSSYFERFKRVSRVFIHADLTLLRGSRRRGTASKNRLGKTT